MAEYKDTLPSPVHAPAREPSAVDRPCLSTNDVLAFVQGFLNADELSALHVHLDRCDSCQRLVADGAHALLTAPGYNISVEESSWDRTFQPNTVLAQRYRIQRFIARGGMGEVYEAYDCDLQERIALKTVASTACDSPLAVRRLKAEVQLARRVSHPNVCRMYDLGTHVIESTGAAISFLTMEFVAGDNLGDWLRTHGALPLEEAQRFARQLLLGLSAAHRAGILHRDFKSDNVMLRSDAKGERSPAILDFGLARALDADAIAFTSARNQALVGTLAYMAPEQIEGKPLLACSDVYAFGVVWFEMLTGQLPFSGSSAAANALERLRKAPVAPSSLNPQVPKRLDAVVLRCLSRHPADRFSSADQVLAALDALSDAPPKATPRRWIAVAAVAAAGAALGLYRSLPRHAVAEVRATARQLVSDAQASKPTPAMMQAELVLPKAIPAPVAEPAPPTPEPRRPARAPAPMVRPEGARPISKASASAAPVDPAAPAAPAAPSLEPIARPEAAAAPSSAAPSARKPDWEDPFKASP